jgi:hypothetical protein
LHNEFTDGGSYGRGSGRGWKKFQGEEREVGFTEDKACILFGDVEGEDI